MRNDAKPAVLNVPFGTDNPYQRMMYATKGSNYSLVGGRKNFPKFAVLAEKGQFSAVHIHWDDLIFNLGRKQETGEREKRNQVILESMERIKKAGVPIVFTVHNARPHSPRIELDTFLRTRQKVCDLSDIIHVHTQFAADEICREFDVDPKKIRLIPHPSYLGVYEDEATTLRRPPSFEEKRKFLFFGAFRRNKGIDRVVDALDALQAANLPFHAKFSGRIRDRVRSRIEADLGRFGDDVSLNLDRVPDHGVPALFSWADVFLAPFSENVLTSGSIMLAQTFGLPVIAPNTAAMRDMLPASNHSLLFDPQDPKGLSRAMQTVCCMEIGEMVDLRAQALAFAHARSPEKIASLLSREIDKLILKPMDPTTKNLDRVATDGSSRKARPVADVTATKDKSLVQLATILDLDRPVQVMDIGANPMGRKPVYQRLIENDLCAVTGFDPQKETLDELAKSQSESETYLPYALGDGKQHQLNIYRGSGLTSLLKLRRHSIGFLRGLKRAARPVGQQSVDTWRLDDLADVKSVDFLKIDIQGAELMVMQNALRTLKSTLAIQAEVSFFPLYENQPTFGDIDVFLRKQNFVPFDFAHIERRVINQPWKEAPHAQIASQMLDGDIIYIRDLSQPDSLSNSDLKCMALLAAGVFETVDLTLKCLDLLMQRKVLTSAQIESYISHLKG